MRGILLRQNTVVADLYAVLTPVFVNLKIPTGGYGCSGGGDAALRCECSGVWLQKTAVWLHCEVRAE